MKLGSKTLLVLAGVLTFSVALNFGVLQNLVFPSFVSLEEEAAEQNLSRVTDALKGRKVPKLSITPSFIVTKENLDEAVPWVLTDDQIRKILATPYDEYAHEFVKP